jgi:uncharacterized membrane protein required for colicin V production
MGYGYRRPRPVATAVSKLPAIILFLAVALFIAADLLLGFDFNWVDYAVVIIIALFGLRGYIRGLINTIFSFAGYIIGIICAFIFSPKLALITMQKTGIGKSIGNKVQSLLPGLAELPAINIGEAGSSLELLDNNPELNNVISGNPLLKQLMTITNSAADTGTAYQETVLTVNDMITFTILKVLAIVLIFIVVKLVVVLIGKIITSMLNQSTVMGTANRTGGMLIGLGIGIIIIYAVCVYTIPFIGSLNIIKKLPDEYTNSLVLKWFNDLLLLINGSR